MSHGAVFPSTDASARPRTPERASAGSTGWTSAEGVPAFTGAASVDLYLERERRLVREGVGDLRGLAVLCCDCQSEPGSTPILQWMDRQGARVHRVDVPAPAVGRTHEGRDRAAPRTTVAEAAALPFADRSFDVVCWMGMAGPLDSAAIVCELARLLKPGGRLVLRMSNRREPFLRAAWGRLRRRAGRDRGGGGQPRPRRDVAHGLEQAGLSLSLESGLPFLPGWLRALDRWSHARVPSLARLAAALVASFAWLDRHVPAVGRRGGPTALVAVKIPRGVEHVVDARGCDAAMLRSPERLQALFAQMVADLSLRPVKPAAWHVFPGPGGITGMVLLAESHLTIHTYPEYGLAAINLYSCRGALAWPWAERLRAHLGAREVTVRDIDRGGLTAQPADRA